MLIRVVCLMLGLVLAVGCGTEKGDGGKMRQVAAAKQKIEDARAKLDDADRALVEAQDYCPIMPEQRLGSMGVPLKLTLKGQPVFVCCKGCKGPAEEDPDGTLKAVAELKAKKK